MSYIKNAVFVIAQSWPDESYGGSIAITSSLKQYELAFDKVVFICFNKSSAKHNLQSSYPKTDFIHIPVSRGGFLKRFIAGVIHGVPAITIGISGKRNTKLIKAHISSYLATNSHCKWFCVFDDNVPSIHLPKIKRAFPSLPIAFRSHDILSKAFSIFTIEGNVFSRIAWSYEVKKIFEMEKESTVSADFNWCITSEDKLISEKLYNKNIDGFFDSDIDFDKYSKVTDGEVNTILYLGTADKRKSHGIVNFISNVLPKVNSGDYKLRFLLGGKNTDSFSDSSQHIYGLGFICDEVDFLSKGKFFLNPQLAGSGLKLKSLIAMASGKVLITTENGALGVGGRSGDHFITSSSNEDMLLKINDLLSDADRANTIGANAKQFIFDNFSFAPFTKRIQPLLSEFKSIDLTSKD